MSRTILTAVLVVSAATFGFVAGRMQSPASDTLAPTATAEHAVQKSSSPVAENVAPEAPAAQPECPPAAQTPEVAGPALMPIPAPGMEEAAAKAEPVEVEKSHAASAPTRRAARKAGAVAHSEAAAADGLSGDDAGFRKFAKHLKNNGQADRFVRRAIDAAEAGNQKLALTRLKKALGKNPHHAVAHLLWGVIAQLSGELSVAQMEYSRYLESDPEGEFSAEVRAILDSGLKAPTNKVASR